MASSSALLKQFFQQINNSTTILNSDTSTASEEAIWNGRYVTSTDPICSEIRKINSEHLISTEKSPDIKLVERICSVCDINKKDQEPLKTLGSVSPKACAIFLKDLIIYNSIKKQLPSNPFYNDLSEWVTQGDISENRAGAAVAIIESYQNKTNYLFLDKLNLKSLPDVLRELPHLNSLSCENNNLTTLPDVFDHLPMLTEINLSHNNSLTQFPTALYRIKGKLDVNLTETPMLTQTIITPTLQENITRNDWTLIVNCYGVEGEKKTFEKSLSSYKKDIKIVKKINIETLNLTSKQQVLPSENLPEDVQKMLLQKQADKSPRIRTPQDLKNKTPSYTPTKLRLLSCGNESTPINVFGCRNPSHDHDTHPPLESLSFIYDEIDTIISLMKRGKENEPNDFLKQCAGATSSHPVEKVLSMPITDYQPPRLEHYLQLAKEMKSPRFDGHVKGILFFCGFGEGRTGTLLAAAKVLDKANKLDSALRKQLLTTERDFTPDTFNGTFTHLDKHFKTTSFVGKIVQDLRQLEMETIPSGIGMAVETPAQFQTLELLHNLLSISEKLNDTPPIRDDQILQIINEKNFSQDTIDAFFQINHNLKSQEQTILEAVKQFHSVSLET